MNKSESIKELATALSKAQAEMNKAVKDSVNPFFEKGATKGRYADLESVWDACREPLTKHGLSVIQLPTMLNNEPALETMLLHSSGEWICDVALLNPVKKDPQGVGSAISYMRRYALAAAVGVIQTDDDGNDAMNFTSKTSQPKQQSVTKSQEIKQSAKTEAKAFLITDIQLQEIVKLARGAGWKDDEIKTRLSAITKKPDSSAWTAQDYNLVLAHFTKLNAANPQLNVQ